MQWPAAGAVVVILLVVLSTVPGPAVGSPGPVVEVANQADAGQAATADLCEGGPPEPETDAIGWEAGCWFNESIAVDQSDGLNASERNATIARTMARVEHIRQLEFERTVPVEIMSRVDYRESRLNDSVDPAMATFDNGKFEALFLIGANEDSIRVQNENTGVAVLGFYSSQREAIVLISENASTLQVDELTLAHELVHALQDQHFNLSRFDARTRDGSNAESGLIEGDARLVELRYEDYCEDADRWGGSCLSAPDATGGAGGELANIGTYLMKFQPYSDGPAFISSLYREGGWEAVNAVYEAPPTSTSQIIHPERYPAETPRAVELEDRNDESWERVQPPNRPDYESVGEAAVFMMLWYPGYDSQRQTEVVPYESFLNVSGGELSRFQPYYYESRFSRGWDGDRMHIYANERDEVAYVWRLAWETPADAREFVRGYEQVLRYWEGERVGPNTWVIGDGGFGGAYHVTVEDETVTIVNAPSTAELSAVYQGIQVTPTPTPTSTAVTDTPTVGETPTARSSPPPFTTDGQPGFGLLAALAVVTGLLLWRSRR